MPRIRFARLLIIESLPSGQHRSGHQLYEALKTVAAIHSISVEVEYAAVTTAAEFASQLQRLYSDVVTTGRIPLIHIECHGNGAGLGLSSGDFIYWEDLCEHLARINKATGFDLFVSISACLGAYLISELNPIRPAPFSACLSVTKTAYPDELYQGFDAFFRTVLTTNSASEALRALKRLNDKGQSFYLGEASDFFRLVCKAYFQRMCTPEKYEERVKRIQEDQAELGHPVASREQILSHLIAAERPYFEKFRQTYFMLDMFPENALRFPVTFEELRT